ncbi:MAG: CaiB/BaiF CoA transferase family protein [Steroidobacteraceae bacterium]
MRLGDLRVLDFCWVGAGAFVTKILADLGAEVIKVESRAHPDNLRLSGPYKSGAKPLENSGYFASRNSSKKSLSLNMSKPRARELALQLASHCNIVSNNFRPGIMDSWGLGYEQVARVNPSVIYLSMPMQGASGPHSDYIGFGATIAALCGLASVGGLPGRTPIGTGTHFPDHIPNPGHALVALLAAIYHRNRTGEGQCIELAQIESTVNVLGPFVLQYSAIGLLPQPTGNRRTDIAPCGVFPCAASDTWCAIEVQDDGQWLGLCAALNNPISMRDPGWRLQGSRLTQQDHLEAALRCETKRYDAKVLSALLREHGVCASSVNTNADVLSDPQLAARGYWRHVQHAEMGELIINAPPFEVVGEGRPALGAPPLLGQHTVEIATDVLGLSASECERLIDEQVFY